MGNAALPSMEAGKQKAEPARMPAMKPRSLGAMPGMPNFLSAAGNMAIQRAAAGPLAGNPASAAILGGANMSGGGCSCGGGGGTCEECNKKPLQRKGEADAPEISQGFHSAMGRSGGGAPLGPHTRAVMEDRFGQPFEDVRIHSDGAAAEAARHIRAHAFTTGRDIYFGQGRYEPHSSAGQKLLAHELTHVLQQRRGAVQPGLKSLNATAHDDVFEREAEHVEARFEQHEHGIGAQGEGPQPAHSGLNRAASVQRKCACGGGCSSCSGGHSIRTLEEQSKAAVQRKAEDGPASSGSRKTDPERTARGKAIQRKCDCGGTCSQCSGNAHGPHTAEPEKKPLQRKAEETSSARLPQSKEAIAQAEEKKIQRKCDCAGTGPQRPRAEEEPKIPMVQRKMDTKPDRARELAIAGRAGRGPGEKKREARRSDKNTGAHAKGASETRGTRGSRPGRNLIPAIQRSAAKAASSARDQHFEREAHAAANDVAHGRRVAAEKLSPAEPRSIQALDWEWCNIITDPDCTLSSTASVVGGEASEIASEVWDEANELADAVGGFLSYVNNLLTITIPPMNLLGAYALEVNLPELGLDLPFLAGAVPIAPGIQIYGEVGLHVGLTPKIGLQVGPFSTHEITIAIHPLTLGGEVSGGFDLTIAGLLGGEARAGIFGEVGVIMEWPEPPLVIKAPLVNIQAGLEGTLQASLGDQMSVDFHADAGITGFDFDLNQNHNLAGALDVGLGGYGKLSVLGINLCTLKWPLYQAHKDAVISLGLDFGLSAGATGLPEISANSASGSLDQKGWDDLGIEFERDMQKDDCPLCDFLYAQGLMPSQRGGSWKGHPKPVWPDGPLSVYPRDPHIKSGALCRGACGPDCDTCRHEKEHRVCEETGDGCHMWWVYPNYETCGSHGGCRNHDACYDWCVDEYNEKGKMGIILGPCHRLCDLECICNYNTPQCVGWIGGGKPHDGEMVFSEAPRKEPGCRGPCPTLTKTAGGAPQQRLCLPDITLIERQSVLNWHWSDATKDYPILSIPLEIPYIPPPTLEVYVRAAARAGVRAGVGPVTLENLCLIYDPNSHAYSGTGSMHLKGDLGGDVTLTGTVGAVAGWGCLNDSISLEVIRGEADLAATAAAHIPLNLSATAKVSCRNGKLTLDLESWFKAHLDLYLKLEASLRVLLFRRWEIFSDTWELASRRWGRSWDIPLGMTSGEIGGAACGGGTAAGVLGLPAQAGPPPALTGAGAAAAAPGAAAPGTSAMSHPEFGHVPRLSIKDLVTDMFHMATDHEVINDENHGSLPDDPAKEAGEANPCSIAPDKEPECLEEARKETNPSIRAWKFAICYQDEYAGGAATTASDTEGASVTHSGGYAPPFINRVAEARELGRQYGLRPGYLTSHAEPQLIYEIRGSGAPIDMGVGNYYICHNCRFFLCHVQWNESPRKNWRITYARNATDTPQTENMPAPTVQPPLELPDFVRGGGCR
jgi:hypothetical protein